MGATGGKLVNPQNAAKGCSGRVNATAENCTFLHQLRVSPPCQDGTAQYSIGKASDTVGTGSDGDSIRFCDRA